MDAHTGEVQVAVQQLLMEHGEYSPLELLLAHPDPDERGIELRRALQSIHPGLLQRYLAKRGRPEVRTPGAG